MSSDDKPVTFNGGMITSIAPAYQLYNSAMVPIWATHQRNYHPSYYTAIGMAERRGAAILSGSVMIQPGTGRLAFGEEFAVNDDATVHVEPVTEPVSHQPEVREWFHFAF